MDVLFGPLTFLDLPGIGWLSQSAEIFLKIRSLTPKIQ